MSPRSAIYLDANAGAPLRAEVRAAIQRALSGELIPNPSSIHAFGRTAKSHLNGARDEIARTFGSSSSSHTILFTASGTEASQLAIRSALEPVFLRGEKPHWITTPVEHDATLQMVEWTKERGGSVDFLPVDRAGFPVASAVSELRRPETALISSIWVNNETGVISDVAALADAAKKAQLPLHLDGAQAWGKIPLNLPQTGASYVSFSGHKIGALSGTGILWPNARVSPLIRGHQESGLRGGTENLLGIVSVGAAARALNPLQWAETVAPVRDLLQKTIRSEIEGTHVNGESASRVANTLSLSFDGIRGFGLVPALDLQGFALSSGSACSSGVSEPSHVLRALGHSRELASASIRISLDETLAHDSGWIDFFVKSLKQSVQSLRK